MALRVPYGMRAQPEAGTIAKTGEERKKMKDMITKLSAKIQSLMMQEEGQDLVEYALVVALIAFGAITAMGTLANDIGTAFTNIGTKLTSAA
jgi:pilus assembly protein Flp/PilA